MSSRHSAWIWKLAWRDARSGGPRLLLAMTTIVAGIAALVAVRSFADNLAATVDAEARVLLGADLEIYGRRPFPMESGALFAEIGGDQARQVATGSMAYFPATGSSRLVSVRAVEGGYPFYGRLETEPPEAADRFAAAGEAVVDQTLMLQYGVEVGDEVRIGEATFRITGRLVKIPGEVPTASLVGPRVFIGMQRLDETRLIQPGSRATWSVYFRLPDPPERVAEWVETLRPRLRELGLEAESVQYRRQQVGESLNNLYDFLYLAGLVALLLGGVGVASSVHLHARSKVEAVAVLRCLGAPPRGPVLAFVIQAVAMGGVGSVAGTGLGLVAQALIPRALAAFLPVQVPFVLSPGAIVEGLTLGLVASLVFALLPLLPLRHVSPLRALRLQAASESGASRDPAVWGLALLVVLGVVALVAARTGRIDVGLGATAGLFGALLVLAGAARLLRWMAHRLVAESWPYEWRQGAANLYRPHNQTLMVMLALGFGTFLLTALVLVQRGLLESVAGLQVAGGANLVLFDVQPDQLDATRALVLERGMPILQQTPVVPMRLARLRSRPVADIEEDEVSAWVLRREYNSTYRDSLANTEELVAGEWSPRAALGDLPVPVSLEEGIAERLGVGVGDTLAFDVQGLEVAAVVGSIRRVDWRQVSPNFFVVFPAGVLEPAPQQLVLVTRAADVAQSADLQRAVVEAYGNVSVMDLALVLDTVDGVLRQVAAALRFMASFSVLSGVAVLVVAALTSRAERRREAILLRTLGASRRQIATIGIVEYLLIGLLAAATGSVLAVAGAWTVLIWAFESEPGVDLAPVLVIGASVTLLTVVVGLWGSRGVSRRPPLEVLRGA